MYFLVFYIYDYNLYLCFCYTVTYFKKFEIKNYIHYTKLENKYEGDGSLAKYFIAMSLTEQPWMIALKSWKLANVFLN